MRKYIVIIPARLESSRLPGKPLLDINGIPMIVWTYNQCVKVVDEKNIYVATDSIKIQKVCSCYKIKSILTSKKCLTGTDRVAEVAKKIKARIYINLQGDEPVFNILDLKKLIKVGVKNPDKIINGYAEILEKEDFFNVNIPKVVFAKNSDLIYMSRSSIPFNKKKKFIKAYRQICAYSIPHKYLKLFHSTKKSPLEMIEDIEIVRFLDLGIKVKMIKMSDKSISVDTRYDLKKVRKLIFKKENK